MSLPRQAAAVVAATVTMVTTPTEVHAQDLDTATGQPDEQSAKVRIDAEHSSVRLERQRGVRRHWDLMCHAPCVQTVDLSEGWLFRFSDDGPKPSSTFRLDPGSDTAFEVAASRPEQWAWGWVAVGVGSASFGAGVITGLSVYLGGGRGTDADLGRRVATRFGIGGGLMGAGVVLGVGVGLPLLLTSGTHYEIVEQRAWLDLQPDGIRVSF